MTEHALGFSSLNSCGACSISTRYPPPPPYVGNIGYSTTCSIAGMLLASCCFSSSSPSPSSCCCCCCFLFLFFFLPLLPLLASP
uniref:Uncharacterized protein n=1 Tax=Arundo donax TaxID=35708 RepID=A0A0A8Y2Z3_ARUDO